MRKFALLVGVGKYQSQEFPNLAATARDVEAIRHVLLRPEVGEFVEENVTTLLDPEPQQFREALEHLFTDRAVDDLLVLYFSGHGVVDDGGKFHLTTSQTDKGRLPSKAIDAIFVLGLMEGSRSKHQVLILDCCFSAAFANDMKAKGDPVNLQPQLGGRGRAVLTSSSATEYSFEQKEGHLSVYTQYVEEGLRTGIADADADGWISVNELHKFVCSKVREAAPAMQPKIYAVEEGFNILLAKAPVDDPKLAYRKDVERLAKERDGNFSEMILQALANQGKQLGLTLEVMESIRNEVLQPYAAFLVNLDEYEQALQRVVQTRLRISREDYEDLRYLQKALGLTDDNVEHFTRELKIFEKRRVLTRRVLGKFKVIEKIRHVMKKIKFSHSARVGISLILLGGILLAGLKLFPVLRPQISLDNTQAKFKQAEEKLNIGNQKFEEGDFKSAISYYDEVIRIKPDQREAYVKRSDAHQELGDYKTSLNGYNTIIKKFGDSSEALTGRGDVRSKLGDSEGAVADYNKALEINPNNYKTYDGIGNVLAKSGDNQGAMEKYNKALEINPSDYKAHDGLGDVHAKLGDYRNAISAYGKALKIQPAYFITYNERGVVRYSLGDYEGAIDDYDAALKLKPDYDDAYYNRGNSRRELNDAGGAAADYKRSAELYQQQGKIKEYEHVLTQIKKLR
jgi:tetratricopeptide (TPR) repeat protein